MRSVLCGLAASVVAAALCSSAARATQFTITDDTYVDSTYSVVSNVVVANTQGINFDTYTGTSGSSTTPSNLRAKVVSSNGSTQFPGNSRVRTLFMLPQSFWDEYDTGKMHSATVSFTLFNNSLNTSTDKNGMTTTYSSVRDVELHPMTQSWNTQTATWLTYDGVHGWSGVGSADHVDPGTGAGGGDYDASRFVDTVNANVASGSQVSWDITPFLSDSTAMSELRANGALLVETSEQTYTANRFYSMYSYNAGLSTAPIITTDVPEPATIGLAMLGLLPMVRRRRV